MDDYSRFIHVSRYARYKDDLGRRETWEETVKRYVDYWRGKFPSITQSEYIEIENAITAMETMPSMRALMTAGPALDRDHVAGYNCSYVAMNRVRAFDEIMYILLCGTGVGFSVERQFINQLPEVAEEFHATNTVIKVRDSKIGWATAFKELISLLYAGQIPGWDVFGVRPAGARLKTFGGRSSGPEPLVDLFRFTIEVFRKAAGRKLTSLEVHDIVCKVADIVVVGGVRRSALISLSNLTDERMRNAKNGMWWEGNNQRALANNSVAYTEKPDMEIFLKEWSTLYESKSGERGVFNRVSSKKQSLETGRRDASFDFGTNPCGEIILRDREFCNLTEVVVRPGDTLETLRRKVRVATILGTLQSTLTDFRYLSAEWKKNCEEERLLGVSLTGIMDHPVMSGAERRENNGLYCDLEEWLLELRNEAIETNKEWAARLGINPSAAITTVKPSGTVSQLVDSASGIHPRYSDYYIRRVRADKKDPLGNFMRANGIPCEDVIGKEDSTEVFSFPVKSPESSVKRNDMTAMEQLDLWLIYRKYWCEHNPSVTIYYRPEEFLEIGAWVYKHFDEIGGVSFLPHSDHVYRQAPYEEITKEQYEELKAKMPTTIKWEDFREEGDNTTASQELACTGNACEIV